MHKNILSLLISILIITITPRCTTSAASHNSVTTILEPSLKAAEDYPDSYPNGVYPIMGSSLVLVRSDYDDISGIYNGKTGERITPGYFHFKTDHDEEIDFYIYTKDGMKVVDYSVIMVVDRYEKHEGGGEEYELPVYKYGFLHRSGVIAIPFEYDKAEDFSNGLAQVAKDGKRGFINIFGEAVVPIEYDYDYERQYLRYENRFSEGMAAVSKDGKWGFVDKSGNVVVSLEYDAAEAFGDGMAAVCKDGKWGFINAGGELVVPLEYASVNEFCDGVATVNVGDSLTTGYEWSKWKMGLINKKGELLLPAEYNYIGYFNDGLAEILIGDRNSLSGRKGFINTSGEIVIPIEYDDLRSFENGLAMVCKKGKWGFIDTSGEIVIPLECDWIWRLGDDFYGVSIDKTNRKSGIKKGVGVLNKEGEFFIPTGVYDEIHPFVDGFAIVGKGRNNKIEYGIINTNGEIVLPIEYDSMGGYLSKNYTDGLLTVRKNGISGILDTNTRFIIPLEYNYNLAYLPVKDLAIVVKDDKEGIITLNNEVVLPLEYNRIIYVHGEGNTHYFWVKKDGLWGVISVFGSYVESNPKTGIKVLPIYIIPTTLLLLYAFVSRQKHFGKRIKLFSNTF
ncbi:MAG: WG repeat-containing protein [Oscillospiraceae bacterium]|nr:WG repeat-containing protein [Oscillospiraceae bacterium]